jgi:hypothetical protein
MLCIRLEPNLVQWPAGACRSLYRTVSSCSQSGYNLHVYYTLTSFWTVLVQYAMHVPGSFSETVRVLLL